MKLELAQIKKRLQVRAALAITLESGRIIVDLVRQEETVSRVMKSCTLPVGAEEVIADPEKAGGELAAALTAAGITEKRCVVCVPPGWALTTSTEVPAVGTEDLRGYLELRAERELPVTAADVRVAHSAYALPDSSQRATLAAIPAKRVEAVERMLDVSDRRAVSISLGLDDCLLGKTPGAVHFLSNGNHVDMVVAAGGGIAAVRSLHGPPPLGTGSFDAAHFTREVRITLGGLPPAVREQVREARFSGAPVSSENLCIEIRQDLRRLGIDSRLQRPADGSAEHPGAALAAADHFLRREPVTFEFLPPKINRWEVLLQRFDNKRRRWIVAAAAAFIVLPVLIFFVRSHIESGLEADWNGMHRNVDELDAVQQKIRQFRPWFDTNSQGLLLLEGLTNSFPDTGEVWAKTIQVVDGSKVTCTGFAKNLGALNSLLDRLRARPDVTGLQVQQERGQNPIQFSFIYKWEAHDAK